LIKEIEREPKRKFYAVAPTPGELNEMARKRARRAVGQYGLMDNERDPKDNYETPPDAVHQLLGHVKLAGGVWDPSCGRGAILKALLEANVGEVVGSDKHVHDMRQGVRCHPYVVDFMDMTKMPAESSNIVMNPPFDQADDHVRHALRIVPSTGMVCVLLRLTWIAAKKRSDLLAHLSKVIICGRLKMLPPDVPDQGHNGAVDFAWFVFVPHAIDATHIVRAK
jgi:hypothetical protein